MFGDEDIINNRHYTTTVRCLSTTASLYCIKAEEFISRFGKDDRTWTMVVERAYKRDQATKTKIKNCVINLNLNQQMKITTKQIEATVTCPTRSGSAEDARGSEPGAVSAAPQLGSLRSTEGSPPARGSTVSLEAHSITASPSKHSQKIIPAILKKHKLRQPEGGRLVDFR